MPAGARRGVGQLDHPRLLGAPGIDAEETPASEPDQLGAVVHLDIQPALLTDPDRGVGHGGGGEESRWSVGQVPGHVRRLSGEQPTRRSSLHPRRAWCDQGELGDRSHRRLALQDVIAIAGEENALDQGLAGQICTDDTEVSQDQGQ